MITRLVRSYLVVQAHFVGFSVSCLATPVQVERSEYYARATPWTMGLFGKKKAPPPSHKAPGALKNSFAEPTSPPSRTSTPSPKSVAQAPSKKAGASKPQRRSTMETRSFADKLESRNRAEALHRSARAQQHP